MLRINSATFRCGPVKGCSSISSSLIQVPALLFVFVAFFVSLLAAFVWDILHAGSPSIGIGVVLGWLTRGFAPIIGSVLAPLVLWRYTFAYPMFAIAHGAKIGFLDECIARTRPVWKIAALVMLIESLPFALISVLSPVVWAHVTASVAAHTAVELAVSALTSCCTVWFILFRTGLALQLMQEQSPISAEPDAGSSTNLADGYIA